MPRLTLYLFSLVLLSCSVGCRMCGPSLDECVPAFLERSDDYRGNSPFYRAGSIYGVETGKGISRAVNAGNFGITTPVSQAQLQFKKPGYGLTSPDDAPDEGDSEFQIPTMEDLTSGVRGYHGQNEKTPAISLPANSPFQSVPVTEPVLEPMPTTEPVPEVFPNDDTIDNDSIETIPFADTFTESSMAEPSFTVEDLRRLESSEGVTDIEILNIEDTLDESSTGSASAGSFYAH